MITGEIYTFTIVKDGVTTISKDYCFLSDFDAKIQSSVLFLLSAEKDKKTNKDFIERLKKELKTDLEHITAKSNILQYLNKSTFVKDYYGDNGRYYKLIKK